MTLRGHEVVILSGGVEFAHRRVSTRVAAARGAGAYAPYELRFVDGWNYIEIDAAVQRPPKLHADAQWVAFRGKINFAPVPDRAITPSLPIEVIDWVRTKAIAGAHFVDRPGSNPRRVAVRFRDAPYIKSEYTYSIDARGEIAAVTAIDRYGQGVTLDFAYGTTANNITAPTDHVQRLAPGENLYPTSTTTPRIRAAVA